jgi:fused signal recognition particle receptor
MILWWGKKKKPDAAADIQPETAPASEALAVEAAPNAAASPHQQVLPEALVLVAEPAPETPQALPQEAEKPRGLLAKLADGLKRSSAKLTDGLTGLFTRRKLDKEALEELEDLLIASDMGTAAAGRIIAGLKRSRFEREVTDTEVREALAEEIAAILAPCEVNIDFADGPSPRLVLFVGVNGSGKTTTMGKIAASLAAQGVKALLVAGDTFRAAAIDQLKVWGERSSLPVLAKGPGADAAGLVYEAFEKAQREGLELVLVDTAGRLQNRTELMSELAKILRVVRKLDADAPHDVFLVLDATVGQNALSQVEAFMQTADVTGLIMTKLDGTARGGVLVALAERFKLPVHFVGVGERAEDLQPFSAARFARALVGLAN